MGRTVTEKWLLRRIPEQWRSLLTPLLSGQSRRHADVTTALAMRYRRQAVSIGIGTTESWDELLRAMSQKVPMENGEGVLSFQNLLWCFPDYFTEEFLKFLLRCHDIVSADSMHNFLFATSLPPPPESCSPSVADYFKKLSTALAERIHRSDFDQSLNEKGDKKAFAPSVEMLAKNIPGEDRDGETEMMKEERESVNMFARDCDNERKTAKRHRDFEVFDETDEYKSIPFSSSAQAVNFAISGKGKRISDVVDLSEDSAAHFLDHVETATDKKEDENTNSTAREKISTSSSDAKKMSEDNFVIVLDSSDEEDEKNDDVIDNKKLKTGENQKMEDGNNDDDGVVVDDKKLKPGVNQKRGEVCEMGVEFRKEACEKNEGLNRNEGDEEEEGRTMGGQATMPEDDLPQKEESERGDGGDEFEAGMQRLGEALKSGDREVACSDLDFLLSASASQVSRGFASMEWSVADEDAVCGLIQGVIRLSGTTLSRAVSAALVDGIFKTLFEDIEETPSRQLTSCLSDLAAAFPHQVASSVCDRLRESPCNSAQAEVVSSLCKTWPNDALQVFLRNLCKSDLSLDDQLLAVVQCLLGRQLELSSDLLESMLHLLETGCAPFARNAKYGRLVMNFVKYYKTQISSSHAPVLQSIVGQHSSVIRKSLQSAVNLLNL